MNALKSTVTAVIALLGGWISSAFGGWDSAMTTLVIFMTIDYITGLIVAGVFHASAKSETGALESRAGWKGLCRKGMSLLIVLIGARIDLALGVDYVKNAVVIGFVFNEAISILENAGLMGLEYPPIIKNALDLLKKKSEEPPKATGEE